MVDRELRNMLCKVLEEKKPNLEIKNRIKGCFKKLDIEEEIIDKLFCDNDIIYDMDMIEIATISYVLYSEYCYNSINPNVYYTQAELDYIIPIINDEWQERDTTKISANNNYDEVKLLRDMLYRELRNKNPDEDIANKISKIMYDVYQSDKDKIYDVFTNYDNVYSLCLKDLYFLCDALYRCNDFKNINPMEYVDCSKIKSMIDEESERESELQLNTDKSELIIDVNKNVFKIKIAIIVDTEVGIRGVSSEAEATAKAKEHSNDILLEAVRKGQYEIKNVIKKEITPKKQKVKETKDSIHFFRETSSGEWESLGGIIVNHKENTSEKEHEELILNACKGAIKAFNVEYRDNLSLVAIINNMIEREYCVRNGEEYLDYLNLDKVRSLHAWCKNEQS